MKLAIVVANPNVFAGANKFASDLIWMLKTHGHRVSLCAWQKPIENRCYAEFLDVDEIYLPSKFHNFIRGTMLRILTSSSSALKSCIKNFKPYAIINADTEPAVFGVVKGNIKKIQYCHFPTELKIQKNDFIRLIYRIPYWYLHYKELVKLDAVVCNSRYTQHIAYLLWKYYVPRNRFHVIHPAVNVKVFEKGMKRENKICYVGRIDEEKGIEHVINAFLKIHDETGVSLEIVGGGLTWKRTYYEERLKPKVLELQKDGFPIELKVDVPYSQIVDTLLTSKAMVSFNPEEHFGIVPVEAQAAGCPPVVARGGGQKETVKHGVTGFLAKSPEEIAYYLLLLLKDTKLWLNMSQSARKWVSKFSRENIACEWDNLLQKLTL